MVCKEKNVPWLFGVDRKLCPSGSLFGITFAEQWPLGQSFLSTPNSHDRFLYSHMRSKWDSNLL